ncbi:hypothetical protein Tco_0260311 [Tanacetum coccineum]
MNEDKIKKDLEEIETINIELDHRVSKLIAENEHLKQTFNLKSVEISNLNASLLEKVLEITALKDDLRKLKGKTLVDNAVTKHTIDSEMLKIDVEPITPKLVKPSTSASGSQPSDKTKKDKIRQTPMSTLKLLVLKTGDYDLWSIRMEQYLTHTHYAHWEVIVNGDAPVIASASTEGPIPPKTVKQKLARKNELKAKSTLLLTIPDEHLLKFHGIKGEKTLWEAIKTRNKSDLDTMSMDDLYNNLKVYEADIKSQSSSSSNSQNVAFVSSENTSGTNEAVNTAHEVSTANLQGQASSSSYADDVMFSLFVSQSNSQQLDNEDIEQIDTDDLEEMDLKWQVVMLTMRVKRFLKKTGRNLNFNDKETVGFDKTKGNRNGDVPRRIVPVETPANALVVQDGIGSSSSSSSDSEVRDNSITELKNQLAEALREKDDLKLKLEKFETSSKKLTDLLNSQISVNNKTGIGFDSQMIENELNDIHKNNSEVFVSASDSSVNEIEEENNQVNDRFKKVEGYHAVPPPYTGNYMPSRPDLSFAGLDDSVYKTNVSETITSVPRNESTASKSSKDNLEQPKDVRPSAPIIEEWESDSDDDCVIRPSFEQNKPSYAKINFVKSDENTRKSVIEQHTNRQAENLRKSQSPRVDKRNWNGLMTQKLGDGFEFNKKACFVCGSLNHLIKDCNFYENKMVGKSMLNNMGRVTGQREVRPVWNNAQRVNHQNKLTHPHPKRNFVPTAVLTKSGNVPVIMLKQSSLELQTTPKNSDFKEKVNTAKVNNVTTAGTKAVVSVVQGHEENAVKSSACWIWRPTGNVLNHISKDSGSYMLKRFAYVDPQGRLKSTMAWGTSSTSQIIKILMVDLLHLEEVLNEKGKQHKASCKTKLASSISQPLQMLHMDLFGPTFVNSLIKRVIALLSLMTLVGLVGFSVWPLRMRLVESLEMDINKQDKSEAKTDKSEAKTDKTYHGMERAGKGQGQSQKVNPEK